MGTYMGNLPNNTSIRVYYPPTKHEMILTKHDIGAGGDPVEGVRRDIDLYAPAAAQLAKAGCDWTGVVLWQRIRK